MIISTNDIIKENDYLLDIAIKYQNTDVNIVKTNLKNILKDKYRNRIDQREIAKFLHIDLSTFYSYLYVSHTAVIPLDKLCWICGKLNLSLDTLFAPVKIPSIHNSIWTTEHKKEFIHCYDIDIDLAMLEFNLSKKTAMHYYNLFKRQIEGSDKECLNAKQIQKT